ncbi:MAG: hypothetical protein K0S55_130 [Clostridia bacterium]|nr:hypothetical protein [Clostridia bacterium]
MGNRKIENLVVIIIAIVTILSFSVEIFAEVGADGLTPIDPSTSNAPVWPDKNSINITQQITPTAGNNFDITLKVEGNPDTIPADSIIIIDLSNSMYSSGSGGSPQKLQAVKDAAKQFVRKLLQDPSQENRVCLVLFGTAIKTYPNSSDNPASSYFTQYTKDVVNIENYIKSIENYIDGLYPSSLGSLDGQQSGGTNLQGAISKANEILKIAAPIGARADDIENEYNRSMVLLGDGAPTFSGYPILNMNREDFTYQIIDDSNDYVMVSGIREITANDIIGFDNTQVEGPGSGSTYILSLNYYNYKYSYGAIDGFSEPRISGGSVITRYKFRYRPEGSSSWTTQNSVPNTDMKELAKIAAKMIPSEGNLATTLYTIGYNLSGDGKTFMEELASLNESGSYFDVQTAGQVNAAYEKIASQLTSLAPDAKVYYRLSNDFEVVPGTLPSNIIQEGNLLTWSDIGAINLNNSPQTSFTIKAKEGTQPLIEIATNLIDSHKPWEDDYNETIDSYIEFTNIGNEHQHIQIEPQIVALGCGLVTLKGYLVNKGLQSINENGEVVGDIKNSVILSEKFYPPGSDSYKIGYETPVTYNNIEPTEKVKDKFGINDYPKYVYIPSQTQSVTVSQDNPFHTLYYKYRIQTAYKVRCYYIDPVTSKEILIPGGEFVYSSKNGAPMYFEDTIASPLPPQIEGFVFKSKKSGSDISKVLKPNPDQNVFTYIYDLDPDTAVLKGRVTFDNNFKSFLYADLSNIYVCLFRADTNILIRKTQGVSLKNLSGNYPYFDYTIVGVLPNVPYYVAINYKDRFIIVDNLNISEANTTLFEATVDGVSLKFAKSSQPDVFVVKQAGVAIPEVERTVIRNFNIYKLGSITSEKGSAVKSADFYYTLGDKDGSSFLQVISSFKASDTPPLPSITAIDGTAYVAQKFRFNKMSPFKQTSNYLQKIIFNTLGIENAISGTVQITISNLPVTGWGNLPQVIDGAGTIRTGTSPGDEFYIVYKITGLKDQSIPITVTSPVINVGLNSLGTDIGFEDKVYFKSDSVISDTMTYNWDEAEIGLTPISEIRQESFSLDSTICNGYYLDSGNKQETIIFNNNKFNGVLERYNYLLSSGYSGDVEHKFEIEETNGTLDITFSILEEDDAKGKIKIQKHDNNSNWVTYKSYEFSYNTTINPISVKINHIGNYRLLISLDSVFLDDRSLSYNVTANYNYENKNYVKDFSFNPPETSSYTFVMNSSQDLKDMRYEIYDITNLSNPIKIGDIYNPKTAYGNLNLTAGRTYRFRVIYNNADSGALYDFDLTSDTIHNNILGKSFIAPIKRQCLRIGVASSTTQIVVKDHLGVQKYPVGSIYSETSDAGVTMFYFDMNAEDFETGSIYNITSSTPENITSVQSGDLEVIINNVTYTETDRSKFAINVFNLNNLL